MTEYEKITEKGYLFKITWPIFFELLLQILVGNIDQIMIGKYSETSVGAIANANQIINLIFLSFTIICMATTILVSLYSGSGNKEKVEQIYTVSITVNLLISLVISFIFLFLGENIVTWLNVPLEIAKQTSDYIKIIGSCMFFQGLFLTFSAIFKSNRLMTESFIISVVVNIVNVIGNSILIFGLFNIPAMGVSGAAISSCISRGIGVLIMIYIFKTKIGAKLKFSHIYPIPTDLLKRLMKIGVPAGAESVSYSLSQVCIQRIVNSLGTISLSTKSYVSIFANFSFIYTVAISQATQIVVGFILGTGETKLAHEKVMTTLRLSVLVTFSMAVTIWLISGNLFSLFTSNEEIISLGKTILFIDIFLEIGRACNIVFVRALQTAGDSIYPIIICIIFSWVLALGLGYVLAVPLEMGLVGIWIAMMLDECIRAVLFLFRWKTGKWKEKSLIN